MEKETGIPTAGTGIILTLRQYRHNYRSRKQLLRLDSQMLSDIGLTRSEALAEARKPFWVTAGKNRSGRLLPYAVSCALLVLLSVSISIYG